MFMQQNIRSSGSERIGKVTLLRLPSEARIKKVVTYKKFHKNRLYVGIQTAELTLTQSILRFSKWYVKMPEKSILLSMSFAETMTYLTCSQTTLTKSGLIELKIFKNICFTRVCFLQPL